MIIITPDIASEYYRWLADKYDITFEEAIAHDDKCNCKDWPEFVASHDKHKCFNWD